MMTLETPFAVRLEIARRMIANSVVSLPRHEYDQVEAAALDAHHLARETAQLVRLMQPDRGWYERRQTSVATEQRAYLAAALLGCTRCVHLRKGGPQPVIARLPLRRLDCRRCAQTFRKPPAGDDDKCDVCDRRGVKTFVPFLADTGPLVVGGDVCPACARVLGFESAEQVA